MKSKLLELSEHFIQLKGLNAFSYYDLARETKIRNASIHYYFPTKDDLAIAVIRRNVVYYRERIEAFDRQGMDEREKINHLLGSYAQWQQENKICLIGSLAADFNTYPEKVQQELQELYLLLRDWLSRTLASGREKGLFQFKSSPEAASLRVLSQMMASVQLARLGGEKDFAVLMGSILPEFIG